MKIKNLAVAITLSMGLIGTAQAGWGKKILGAGVIVGAGVVAYKIAKKLNVGSVTYNLSNHPDNAVPYLTDNPSFIPEVRDELTRILNDPEHTPEQKEPYEKLAIILEGGLPGFGTIPRTPTSPIETSPTVSETPKDNNIVINGGKLVLTDEQELEKNMIAAGISKTNGFKATHIVHPSSDTFSKSREVLKIVGVDINSADNGVFLPVTPIEDNKMMLARDTLNNEHFTSYVITAIQNGFEADGKTGVIDALRKLHVDMIQGKKF